MFSRGSIPLRQFLAYGVRTERAAEALQSKTKHTHTPTHQTLQALASVHTFRLGIARAPPALALCVPPSVRRV